MNALPFEAIVIEAVMCRQVDEPLSALRREYWLSFREADGGASCVWSGPTYFGALEAASEWTRHGTRVLDLVPDRRAQ